jgi:hypothetical protein
MRSRAYVVHRIPGRVRLKVPQRRGDPAFFAELQRRAARAKGVRGARVNALTGSFVLEHDGDFAQLASALAGPELGGLIELALALPPVARRLQNEAATLDLRVRRWSGGSLDLSTAAALGLAALAGVQLFRGRQAPLAVSLAWYSAELIGRWKEANPASE